MRSFAPIAVLLAIAGLSTSQQIVPDSVPSSTRASWCSDQKASCPLICLQTSNQAGTASNTCDPTNLAWTCVCKNGQTPNITEYSLTIPFYECQEYGNQCVKACGLSNNACADNCRTQNLCGAQSPKQYNTTTTSATSSATGSAASSSGSSDGTFGGSGATGGSKNGAGSLTGMSAVPGVVVLVGVLGGFSLLL